MGKVQANVTIPADPQRVWEVISSYAVQGGCIQELAGWSVSSTIETEGPWRIADLAARLPAEVVA